MKKIIIIVLIALATKANAQENQINIHFGEDKLYHASAGIAIASTVKLADVYIFEREMIPIAPILVTGAVACFWEISNVVHNDNKRFSGQDVAWTMATAAIVNFLVRKIKKRPKKQVETIEYYNPPLVSADNEN